MQYPVDIIKELEKRNRKSEKPVQIPNNLQEILDVAFFSSLQREEGRQLNFALGIVEPDAVVGDNIHTWQPIVFTESRPFTVDELTKLSPALDYHSTMIGIRDNGQTLEIWGIIHTGPSAMRFGRKAFYPRRIEGQKFLHITIPRPGEIIIDNRDHLLVEYRAGEVVPAAQSVFIYPGPIRQILSSWSEKNSLISNYFNYCVWQIATAMHETGHGGLVFLVPDHSSLDTLIQPKYETSDKATIIPDTLGAFVKAEKTIQFSSDVSRENFDYESEMIERYFEAISFIGNLTSVDGATIINSNLEIIGFGARSLATGNPIVVRALDYEVINKEPFDLTKRGTRFSAAIKFCNSCHGSISIIASHDGLLSCATSIDDEVVVWEPIELAGVDELRRGYSGISERK